MGSSHTSTTLKIKVFAGLREGLRCDWITYTLMESMPLADLTSRVVKLALANAHPDLANLINASRMAVNHTFVDDDASLELALAPGVDIALIPPVSGG